MTPADAEAFRPLYRPFSSDEGIWKDVFFNNEYRLPSSLSAEGVIVDVGAHSGAFACACLARGARRIVAYEPDPESFALLGKNVARLSAMTGGANISLHPKAVWRSDRSEKVRIERVQFSDLTTNLHPAAQSTLFSGQDTDEVETVALDEVLSGLGEVECLKVDCEGAEWPILFTAKRLSQVRRLFMEVHSLAWKAFESKRTLTEAFVEEFGNLSVDDLNSHLAGFGFRKEWEALRTALCGNAGFFYGQMSFSRSR